MIVSDLNVVGMATLPYETDSPLFIDSNAMLAQPIALQFLKAVSWWNTQFLDVYRRIQHQELSFGTPAYGNRKTARSSSPEDILGLMISEAFDHSIGIIAYCTNSGKRYV